MRKRAKKADRSRKMKLSPGNIKLGPVKDRMKVDDLDIEVRDVNFGGASLLDYPNDAMGNIGKRIYHVKKFLKQFPDSIDNTAKLIKMIKNTPRVDGFKLQKFLSLLLLEVIKEGDRRNRESEAHVKANRAKLTGDEWNCSSFNEWFKKVGYAGIMVNESDSFYSSRIGDQFCTFVCVHETFDYNYPGRTLICCGIPTHPYKAEVAENSVVLQYFKCPKCEREAVYAHNSYINDLSKTWTLAEMIHYDRTRMQYHFAEAHLDYTPKAQHEYPPPRDGCEECKRINDAIEEKRQELVRLQTPLFEVFKQTFLIQNPFTGEVYKDGKFRQKE